MVISSASEQPAGRCVAVLIGINEYKNGVPRLRNAVRDVQTVAQVLREEHAYETRLLLDEQATLSGLHALLSALPAELSPDTRLVLYFAGHGIVEEPNEDAADPQGFLIPQDATRDDTATFLPMAEVQARLAKLPCKHLLLLLDCCFAGAFRWSQTRSIRVRPATLYRERYERHLRDFAWQVIASAASDEQALDVVAGGKLGRRGVEDHSPFAATLCRGLRGDADLRIGGQAGDGVILASELHLYLDSAFSQLEYQLGRPIQKPLLWSLQGRDKGQFLFFTPGRSIALPSALELVEKNNPYQGLEPYGEDRAELFFGRQEVVEQLYQQVQAQPLTVVSGISGSGKSSVVRAGLLSRLHKASDWFILPAVRPGSRPLSALASVTAQLGQAQAEDFSAAVASWQAQHPDKQLLLLVDQVEELVTMGAEPAEQQQFLHSIRRALPESGGQLHVVMTLRSDFEPHFVELLTPKPGTQVRFLVRPLNRQELRQVIEGPASERVLYFEPPTLVDQLIDEVAEMPGALPLLSFTMSELYRAYVRSGRSDRCLAAEDYQTLNGVAGALSQRADEIFLSLDAAHRGTLRRVMLRMVSLQAGEVARRRVPFTELNQGPDHLEEARTQTVLKQLKEARLIVSGIDNEGTPYYEPAHDKLVLGWPHLWNFIKQEQEAIPLQRLLTQESAAWQAAKQHRDALLWSANPRLPLLVALHEKAPERFNALEREFITQSEQQRRQREQRQRRQRQLISAALGGTVVVIAAGLTFGLLKQRELTETYVEEGRRLLIDEDQPSEALLWLHKAYAAGSGAPMLPYLLADATRIAESSRVFSGSLAAPTASVFRRDGRRIVIASGPNAAVWEVDSGKLVVEVKGDANTITSTAFSPDGRYIVTAGEDEQMVRVWEADSGKLIFARYERTFADLSPDAQRIATLGGGTVRLWESTSGALLASIQSYQGDIDSVAFLPGLAETPVLTVTGSAHAAQLWDSQGRVLATFKDNHPHKTMKSASVSADGNRVVTVCNAPPVSLWDTRTGKLLAELKAQTGTVHSAALSPDGKMIVTAGEDAAARVWEASSGKLLAELKGHGAEVNTAEFSPSERRIVTASGDGTARIWDMDHGTLLSELKGHTGSVYSAVYSPDGRHIVTGSSDGMVRIWEANPRNRLTGLEGDRSPVKTMLFSPDSGRLLTMSKDKDVRIWLAENGKLLAEIKNKNDQPFESADWSPDGRRIITNNYHQVAQVWEADSGKLRFEIEDCKDAAFSPDGLRILSKDVATRVWDGENGSFLKILYADVKVPVDEKRHVVLDPNFDPDKDPVIYRPPDRDAPPDVDKRQIDSQTPFERYAPSISYRVSSPDGRRIFTVGSGSPRVWDAESGNLLSVIKGRAGAVASAIFSPDGNRILTVSGESARLWDAKSGKLIAVKSGRAQAAAAMAFSPDGLRIAIADGDGIAQIWSVALESRSPAQIAKLIRCRLTFKFLDEKSTVIIPTVPDPSACADSEAPPR